MLTSKQRAYLRSLAVDLDTIVMVGKSGMSGADQTGGRRADGAGAHQGEGLGNRAAFFS